MLWPDQPFTRTDLANLGASTSALRTALRRREVLRVVQGCYVRGDVADTIELRAEAVAKVVSASSVVCDRTAAWLHGIDVFGYADREGPMPVETCVLRGHAPSHRDGVDGRTRDLAPRDVMALGSLRVTSPLRTALDLGCALQRYRAIGALDQFMRLHGVTREELQQEVRRFRRRRGVVQLRELIQLANPLAESMRESWVRLALVDAGVPEPVLQHWVAVGGVPTYRLDLAYPLHKIAIEYDGEEFHHRTDEQRRHDLERRAWLERNGWLVVVVDKERLDDLIWIVDVKQALRSRTKRLRWSRTPD